MNVSDFNRDANIRPAGSMFAITPNDSADLSTYTRGVYVGGAGNLRVTTIQGETLTVQGLLAGLVYPFQVKRVFSTSTTATLLVGLA